MNLKTGSRKKTAAAVVFFLLLALLFAWLGITAGFPLFWAVPCAALAWLVLFRLVYSHSGIHRLRFSAGSAVFSFFLALSFVGGAQAGGRSFAAFTAKDAAIFAAVFFLSPPLVTKCSDIILRHPLRLRDTPLLSPLKVWAAFAVFLFICWIPALFLYYPGNISPDSFACISRALGKVSLSNQQPLIYTLMMKPFLLLFSESPQNVAAGAAAFLVFQAALMAALVGYLFGWLVKQGAPRWILLCAGAYFTLNPVFPMYAVTMWKDILFGGFVLVYVLNLIDIVQSSGRFLESRKRLIWFLILNLLVAFLRNNGYYIIFVTLVTLAAVYRRRWKQLIPAFLAVLTIVPVIQGPVYTACGVSPSPFAESVGIPLQQIALSVKDGGPVTAQQRDFLNRIMPIEKWKAAYIPRISDGIKFNKSFDNAFLEKHKIEFLSIWAQMLGANLSSYAKAYVMQTYGFWNIGTSNWVLHYGIETSYKGQKFGLSLQDSNALMNSAQLKAMRHFVSSSFRTMQSSFFPFGWMINIGMLFWLTVFSALTMLRRKKKRFLLPYLPLFVLWGTLMLATPTFCEFRYMFAYATALPVTLLLPFLPERDSGTPEPCPEKASEPAGTPGSA